ncbi:MerR family transcriptional regulator [Candidatus Leptofilum sp.]|uniref:MerR family transcriptional regulator n=1 Tax=Candidatus Leptofilum sp. TaxID=3241576 RepID=UPI003B5C5439
MKQYTIKQAAQMSGTTVATLRYYEEAGLLQNIQRLPNGHRRYNEQDLAWIDFIICLREGGMPIQQLKRYVDLCYMDGTEQARCYLLEKHRVALKAKIDSLQQQYDRIDDKIDWYHEQIAALAASESSQ